MIAIRRFCELEKTARKAAKKGDLATVATINKDKELRSANVQFMVYDNVCYLAQLSDGDRTTKETVMKG